MTRVLFCSDVHLCHCDWYGLSSEQRLEGMVERLNAYHARRPYEKLVFLGDYSLDFWEWSICGSWLREGVSNTARFISQYASRLHAPWHMLPGNHEQYGNDRWLQWTGTPRESSFVLGGYLFVCCDNFAGLLDPTEHSDGVYSPTNLSYVRAQLDAHPGLPVILCAHFFDLDKEPPAFFDFIRNETRITLLVCGHDHLAGVVDPGDITDHVCIYHDGQYSYSGRTPQDPMWGFCDAQLTETGIDIRYVEPDNTFFDNGQAVVHRYREQHHAFFQRRDLR